MSVSSVSAASQTVPAQDTTPPPEPQLTPAQQGELEAGRIRVAEGQVFDGVSPDAPPTQSWGEQPAGSSYRLAFDSAAQRLGTRDPAQVGAELDRQLYAAQSPDAANDAGPAPAGSEEGVGSFFEGAVKGDLGDNDSWSALAGQTAVGFVPIVGQIADARDTGAAIGQVWRGEEGGWTALGAAAIGWVPGLGDAAKGAIRAGDNVAETGVDAARVAARQGDEISGRISAAADRLGISEAEVSRIVETPRGQRPDPSTYMSSAAIDAHLAPFQASGAVRFTRAEDVSNYGTLGPPGGTFAIPRSELDSLIEETGGDMAQIEQRLGLEAGSLTSGETIAAYIAPEDLRGLRVPSGNERGANDFWVPGGYTSGGLPEATIDTPADVPYAVITFGE